MIELESAEESSFSGLAILKGWPPLPPEEENKRLYVNYEVPYDLTLELLNKGWVVTDVRLLPRQNSIEGFLEGMRLGSINPDLIRSLRNVIDFETKILGMIGSKPASEPESAAYKRTVQEKLEHMIGGSPELSKYQSKRTPLKRNKKVK